MNSMSYHRRLAELARKLQPHCRTCQGQTWRVVIGDEPMPASACPACGHAIYVAHIVEDTDGPQ